MAKMLHHGGVNYESLFEYFNYYFPGICAFEFGLYAYLFYFRKEI